MCFSLAWMVQLIIWVIIICAIIGLLKLLLSFVLPRIGGISAEVLAFITSALRIIIWAIVLIAAVYFIFDLIGCLSGALSFPRLH